MTFSLNKPKSIENTIKNNSSTKKEFIKSIPKEGSITNISQNENKLNIYPWENPSTRKDVLKLFNIRLPEPDWLKLKYIADSKNKSMHQFCLDYLITAINKEIKKITAQENLPPSD